MSYTDPKHRPGVPSEKVTPPRPTGIERGRLSARVLEEPPGLRLVVGPAGSGKTTALAHACASFHGRPVWLSLDGTDRRPGAFARSLGAAMSLTDVDDVLQAAAHLDDGEPTLVVVDDVHEVAGSSAADAIDLLCRYRPPPVTLALGARDLRELHQWRWRTDPGARLIDVDDLRFRLWEVDALFRHLDAPLGPADLHALVHRTDGWAVALRLFHVALQDAPQEAAALLARSPRFTLRSIRGYLREEVLGRLSPDERRFLRRAAVFDRPGPHRCDRLVGAGGSAARLEELAASGLLVHDPGGDSFRLHELLRGHLLGELADELGDDAVASLHRQAATLLEEEGALGQAVRSAARAGDWSTVARLLRHDVPDVEASLLGVPEAPWGLRDRDPWVARAEALRLLAGGDVAGARSALRAAVSRFAEWGGDAATERLLRAVDAWLQGRPGPSRSWVEALRAGLAGDEVDPWPSDQGGRFSRGFTALVRGRVADGTADLAAAVDGPHPVLAAMAAIGVAMAAHLGEEPDGSGSAAASAGRALSLARASEAPAVVVAAGALASLVPPGEVGSGRDHDVGLAFDAFWRSLVRLPAGCDGDELSAAGAVLEGQGLTLPLAAVRAAALVCDARQGRPVDRRAARDPTFRSAGPLAQALASLAVGMAHDDAAALGVAARLAASNGFAPWLRAVEAGPRPATRAAAAAAPAPPAAPAHPAAGDEPGAVAVQVFGGLVVSRGGRAIDLGTLRPRHLDLLQVLAVNAGHWLHREVLWESLWPERAPEVAAHNLHVAISAVRRTLDPDAARGRSTVLLRSGDRYRLEVAPDRCDVTRFEGHLQGVDDARRRGDVRRGLDGLRAARREWRGEPLPAAGPAEWVVGPRDRLRRRFADAATDVLGRAEPTMQTAALATRALDVDPYDDVLWRLAIAHARRAGAGATLHDLETSYAARFTGRTGGGYPSPTAAAAGAHR